MAFPLPLIDRPRPVMHTAPAFEPVAPRRIPDAVVDAFVRDGGNLWTPRSLLGQSVYKALSYLPADLAEELLDRIRSSVVVESSLALAVIRPYRGGFKTEDLGIVCRKVVTDAGVAFIAADIAGGGSDSSLFKFHGVGTGTTAEAAGQTALVTESTTALNPDSTRATGSQSSSTNTYTTVGTVTFDAAAAITEHGIFSQAATGGGTLLDRSVFAAVNVASGDSIQATYVLTLNSGG